MTEPNKRQVSVSFDLQELIVLTNLLNHPQVAVPITEAAAAGSLLTKVRKAREDIVADQPAG